MNNLNVVSLNEKINEINKKHESEIFTLFSNFLEDSLEKYKEQLIQVIEDKFEKQDQRQIVRINNLKNEFKNEIEPIKSNLETIESEQEKIKDVTFVLGTDDGKQRTLTKLVNNLCYKTYTKNKHALEDKLFHRVIVNSCYSRLYDQFEVNSYKRIRIEDFDESLKVINRWYGNEQNIKRAVKNRLNDYVNDKYLPSHKKEMVEKFLEKTNGGNNIEF